MYDTLTRNTEAAARVAPNCFTQAIPFERLTRLISDLLGLEISEGALANMLEASGVAFARQTNLIRDAALQSDETSARVGKKTWWTWVFHNGAAQEAGTILSVGC